MRAPTLLRTLSATILVALASNAVAEDFPGTNRIKFLNYPDSIELTNNSGTRVVLCHQVGGRVLVYSSCKQTIRNISNETQRWCHWGRSFAIHGGIAIIPLTPETSKFPNGYIMMQGRNMMNVAPEDPNIRRRGNFLEVLAPPAQPKLGMDSHAGWLAYQMPNDLVFVKHFNADPDRFYNEIAGLSISVWYPPKDKTPGCELEPIGPRETLAPGETASFTEHWQLIPNPFPEADSQLDLDALGAKIESLKPTTPAKK